MRQSTNGGTGARSIYAVRITLSYLLIGGLWIFFSDIVVEWLAGSEALLSRVQTYKGLFYIGMTGFMLFLLIRRAEMALTQEQQALAESEQQYRVLYESANDGILILKDGKCTDCNPAVLAMLGTFRDHIIGKSPSELSPPVQPDGSLSSTKEQKILTALLAGAPQCFEWRLVHADGHSFDVEVSLNVLELSSGSYIQSLVRDISQRKRTEAQLQEYQNRLRSMGTEVTLAEERERRRIATCLHDGACQILAMSNTQLQTLQARAQPEVQSALTEVSHSLQQVIHDLRDLTMDLSPPTLYMFGLEPAVEELLNQELRIKQGIAFSFHAAEGYLPLANNVRVLLYQSIRELVINIVKHGQADQVDATIVQDGSKIRITLRDNGKGFHVDQIKTSISSTGGFGLFNIDERLRSIGGEMQIESSPGQGSTFILTAPNTTNCPVD